MIFQSIHKIKLIPFYIGFIALLVLSCKTDKKPLPIIINSPNKSIYVTVKLTEGKLSYSVKYKKNSIIEASSLKLELKNPIINGFEVIDFSTDSVANEWSPVYGENTKIKDNYHSLVVNLREKGSLNRLINVEFRVYNEGIAFRYMLPKQEYQNWTILNELSEFNFQKGAKAFPIEQTEQTFSKTPVAVEAIKNKVLTPLTIKLENSFTSIFEANVENFPRMHLKNSDKGVLTSKLLGKAKIQSPFTTPWRAVLIVDHEGLLIENESLVLNLNKPCEIEDTSWIKPGKTISNEGAVPLNTIALKKLVDFASENGFKYVQLDWGWYGTEVKWKKKWIDDFRKMMPAKFKYSGWETNTEADPYTVGHGFVPYGWIERFKDAYTLVDLDIQELINYGKSKDVGISLYIESGSTLPSQDMEKLFATYKKWGVAGLKPGFVKYGRQENTAWIRKMVKTAARNNLWLCIHDAHVPDGFERTYPNLMISEGGGGQEGNHPVVQDVMLPFTRNLVGAFDYTPFFFAKDKTNAHMLAFMLVFYGSAQTIRGAYDALKNSKGKNELEFIKKVPATWDQTKVLNAKIGEYLTIARKNSNDWFIGSMTGDNPQSFEIKLDFLDEGKTYKATIFSDTKNTKLEGWHPVKKEEKMVTKENLLVVDLVKSGGCVITLERFKGN